MSEYMVWIARDEHPRDGNWDMLLCFKEKPVEQRSRWFATDGAFFVFPEPKFGLEPGECREFKLKPVEEEK